MCKLRGNFFPLVENKSRYIGHHTESIYEVPWTSMELLRVDVAINNYLHGTQVMSSYDLYMGDLGYDSTMLTDRETQTLGSIQ